MLAVAGLILIALGRGLEGYGKYKRNDMSPPKNSAWRGTQGWHHHDS
jgi:hypothetical protein